MEHYVAFISEWAGLGALTPAMYLLALAGPFAVFVLVGETKRENAKRIALALAVSGFFAWERAFTLVNKAGMVALESS